MRRLGEHPKVVSERLGHSDIRLTLNTYSHLLPGMDEGAAMKTDQSLGAALARRREKPRKAADE